MPVVHIYNTKTLNQQGTAEAASVVAYKQSHDKYIIKTAMSVHIRTHRNALKPHEIS